MELNSKADQKIINIYWMYIHIGILKLFKKATSNEIRTIFTFTVLLLLVDRIIAYLLIVVFGDIHMGDPFYLDLSMFDQFFLTVIVGPIFETIIFHLIMIELLLFLFRKFSYGDFWTVVFSALFFSLIHYYSIDYIVIAFFGGVVLSSAYIVAKRKEMLPFAIVFLVHVLYNFISFLTLVL